MSTHSIARDPLWSTLRRVGLPPPSFPHITPLVKLPYPPPVFTPKLFNAVRYQEVVARPPVLQTTPTRNLQLPTWYQSKATGT
eukprot:118695-Hanusia_phi.AAC.2